MAGWAVCSLRRPVLGVTARALGPSALSVLHISLGRWLRRTVDFPPPAAWPSPRGPQVLTPGTAARYAVPGRRSARGSRAALPAAGKRRGFPALLRPLFSVFESITGNVAGGGRPPKKWNESCSGDFHCVPRVLLKPPGSKDSVIFLPVPPNPAPQCV